MQKLHGCFFLKKTDALIFVQHGYLVSTHTETAFTILSCVRNNYNFSLLSWDATKLCEAFG